MEKYRVVDSYLDGDKPFVVVRGKTGNIKTGVYIKDETGNMFCVKSVIPVCMGCTACCDAMVYIDIVRLSGELLKEIYIV